MQARVGWQLLPATRGDGQASQLADGGKVIRLDELHGRKVGVQCTVLGADCQVAFGKIQVAHLAGAARRCAQAHAAGVGEQVQYAFASTVSLDPAARVAQVEKQQRVLPGMPSAHAIIQAPFVSDHVGQRRVFGTIHRVFPIDPRVAPRTIVVHQQQRRLQVLLDGAVQGQQIFACQRLMEALDQQLRTIAVDGQATGAFLAAMEQAIAISALFMQLLEQRGADVEGGAQRLDQSGHARSLTQKEGRQFYINCPVQRGIEPPQRWLAAPRGIQGQPR